MIKKSFFELNWKPETNPTLCKTPVKIGTQNNEHLKEKDQKAKKNSLYSEVRSEEEK